MPWPPGATHPGRGPAEVAHPQIRNRGTLGGNLAHADPASEMPAVMLALECALRAAQRGGERGNGGGAISSSARLTTALRARRDAGGDPHAGAAAAHRHRLPGARAAARRLRDDGGGCGGDARRGRGLPRRARLPVAAPGPTPMAARACRGVAGRHAPGRSATSPRPLPCCSRRSRPPAACRRARLISATSPACCAAARLARVGQGSCAMSQRVAVTVTVNGTRYDARSSRACC